MTKQTAPAAKQRKAVPRSAHAEWSPPPGRADPVQILIDQGKDRLQHLLPIRYARMQQDSLGFLRGAAAVMAADLKHTPTTGIRTQCCGDAHLNNFGSYASPEGVPLFDVNDFDETLPAPFEWDVKRLAASLVVAGRAAGADKPRKLAVLATKSYCEHMAYLAERSPIDAWSDRIDLKKALADIDGARLRRRIEQRLEKVLSSGANSFNLVEQSGGRWRIKDKPPLVSHDETHGMHARAGFDSYAKTLPENVRVLLGRYTLRDVAFKIVGVGSVGTFCAIGLFVAEDGSPLLLQIKQAVESVLAPYAGPSKYRNAGERVVVGQRMMQAATDIFLGFMAKPLQTRQFYVRRLKDGRLADIGAMAEEALPFYAKLCGRTLARAHARASGAQAIHAYLGEGESFAEALGDFGAAYADQTEKDWGKLREAIASGRIVAAQPGA